MNKLATIDSINNILPSELIKTECFKVFKILLDRRDISDNTRKALISDLKHFIQWFVDINGEAFTFARLTARDIIDYKRFCKEKCQYAPKTTNRRLSSVRTLCNIAIEEGDLAQNPFKGVKLLPLQPLAPKSLDKRELRALLKEVEIRGNHRDILILEMLCGTGLRVSELVNLKVEDLVISERKGYANIRNGKGGKFRVVPLRLKLRDLITEHKQSLKPEEYLIMGQRGHLTPIAINKIVDVYAKKADIKCSPHTLRHSFAYNYLLQNPGDIVGLSQILGHSNLNTTAIYTQHRLEDLQERVEGMQY